MTLNNYTKCLNGAYRINYTKLMKTFDFGLLYIEEIILTHLRRSFEGLFEEEYKYDEFMLIKSRYINGDCYNEDDFSDLMDDKLFKPFYISNHEFQGNHISDTIYYSFKELYENIVYYESDLYEKNKVYIKKFTKGKYEYYEWCEIINDFYYLYALHNPYIISGLILKVIKEFEIEREKEIMKNKIND